MSSEKRAHWSSRSAFILAAAGSAVGLGNLWKFPYIAGENGGGAFVLIYLACIAAVGLPIFVAELFIGQQAQKNVVESFEVVHKKRTPWRFIGWMGLLAAVCILSFYSVVGGWVLDFEFRALTGSLFGSGEGSFSDLIANPSRQIFWHSVFMALVLAISAGGVKSGLERWNNILMPGLLVILAVLFIYSFQLEGFISSIQFLFAPRFESLTAAGILEAVGHSFFTLSLGMGAIITYGSYLERKENLVKTAVAVSFLDTIVALLAGVVIFAVVFSFQGMEASAGPGLMFSTLPTLFESLPYSRVIAIAFFLLVSFAALTSAVSLLEVIVAYWVEKHQVSRVKATVMWAVLIYLFGLLSALSYNELADFKILGLSIFDFLDHLSGRYLLPLGGMFISIFFGFVVGPKALQKIFPGKEESLWARGFLFLARFIAPVAVAFVIFNFVRQALSS